MAAYAAIFQCMEKGYIKRKKSIDRRRGICYHVNILFALHPTPNKAGATTVQTEQAADSELNLGAGLRNAAADGFSSICGTVSMFHGCIFLSLGRTRLEVNDECHRAIIPFRR